MDLVVELFRSFDDALEGELEAWRCCFRCLGVHLH